jgi:diadenosine tetraphosphate (Ap4A) HIT family hydrolase
LDERSPALATCKTCELTAARDAGAAPLWDCIHRTAHWDVVHSYDSALPGWLVLVARRHVIAIDELTEEEACELGLLLRRVSLALKAAVGCLKTYVAQFAEAAEHPHVHFHVIPRMADQPPERRGPRVFEYLGAPPDQRVPEEEMNRIALKVRESLLCFGEESHARAL